MNKIFSLIGLVILLLILAACGASAPVLPQLSRAEQLAPTGLLNTHEFAGSVEAVEDRCNLLAVPESEQVLARLDWTSQTGTVSTNVDCKKIVIVHDASVSTAKISFVFDQGWLEGSPDHVSDSDGEEDLQFIIPGELGRFQNQAVHFDGVNTVYKQSILVDPNNFLEGAYWLEKVIISVP